MAEPTETQNPEPREISPDTRESLLDAAERLFARRGIDATSLRAITGEAGANLASVHYHFGSKEELVKAVFARRLGPLNAERLRLLAACEAEAGDAPPPLEAILHAFTAPVLHMLERTPDPASRTAHALARLVVHTLSDPEGAIHTLVLDEFREVRERFLEALKEALPDLPFEELCWRFHFMIGALAHTASAGYLVEEYSDGRCAASDVKATQRRLIEFLAAGLQRPAAGDPR